MTGDTSTHYHKSLVRLIAEAEVPGRRVPKSVAVATVEARNTPGARDLRPVHANLGYAETGGRRCRPGASRCLTDEAHRLRPRSYPASILGRQPYQGFVIVGTGPKCDSSQNSPENSSASGQSRSDGERQRDAAACDIQRGVNRLLMSLGMAPIAEFSLANGRRADVAAIARDGEIWIVEIKSSVADFRSDSKWPEYHAYADRFLFAVKPEFPVEILPEHTGLILADRFGGEIVRPAPRVALDPQRRKALTLRFARTAAARLATALDPQLTPRDDAADV